jgi:hypothetical protein
MPIILWDSSEINYTFTFQDSIGHPHGLFGVIIPACDFRYDLIINYREQKIRWNSPFQPRIIPFHEKIFLVTNWITWNLGKNYRKYLFFIYDERTNSWKEIDRKEFPKHLALQNVSFHLGGDM